MILVTSVLPLFLMAEIVALHEAAQAGSVDCCEALLARGCPKRPRTRDQVLPEDMAAGAGFPDCAAAIREQNFDLAYLFEIASCTLLDNGWLVVVCVWGHPLYVL